MEAQRCPGRRGCFCAFRLLAVLAGGALCGIAGPPLSAQQDPWKTLAPLPTPRRLLAAAVEEGKIYTFGGCGSPCFDPVLHPSTSEETLLEVYDPGTNTWSSHPGFIPAILYGAAAAAPGNGRLYVFGGFVTGNTTLEYVPDPAPGAWFPRKPLSTPRHGLAAVALDGDIYVIGGSKGSAPSNALEIYDPDTDSWRPGPPMPTARVFLGAAAVGGKIYAIGGSPDCCGNGRSDAVEIYHPVEKSWSHGAPLPVALQVSAVAAGANGKIYVLGGFAPGSGAQSFTLEYDPQRDSWTFKEPMPVARDQAPAVAMEDDIHVLGGSVACHCRALGDHHAYAPAEDPDPEPIPSISKNDGRNRVAPGDTPVYRINVRNNASVAFPVVVTDRLTASGLIDVKWCCDASGSACTPSTPGNLEARLTLPPNGVALCRATGTVPDALPSSCRISNTACVTPPGRPEGCASDVDRIIPPDLTLDIIPGLPESCEYPFTLVVTNPGPGTARDVILRITSENFVLRSVAGPCASFPCTFPEIAPGSEARVTAKLGWRSGLVCPAVAKITASVESRCQTATIMATSEIRGACDLSITKTDGRTTASPGDPIDYTITVTNLGCLPVAKAEVTDVFPAELEDVKWCRGEDEPEDCVPAHEGDLEDLLDLPVDGTETYRASGTIIDPVLTDKLINTASVKPPVGDEITATDETGIVHDPPNPPCAAVSCEDISGYAIEGGTITKRFVIRNCGPEALGDGPGPEFEDTLPPELSLVSATASRGTVTTGPNTVTWNGAIAPGGMVAVEITATIATGTLGSTICNQGSVAFDEEGVHGDDTCCVNVIPELPVPVLSDLGLYVLAFLLALLALTRLRQSA